jgi:hypothetical protein
VLFGDRTELELRELHVRAELGRTAVSVGKQQIVWGQADGLKVLDVVNPQDFREFILDDFERSRIPLWSTAVETPIGGATLQLIWVPDHSYHHFPPPGSPFDLTARTLPASLPDGVRVEVHPIERPHRVFRDSDVGGRLSTFWKGWDLTANYLYHYDDRPVLTGSISLASDGPHLMLTPRYERAHLVGGSFSNAFGPLTVRGELAMLVKRAFRRDELESPGPVRASELDWVIGFDWLGIRETLLSLQVFQTLATNESTPLAPGQTGTTLSLLVRREWLNDRLTADTMWLHGVTLGDGVVRPRLGYELGNDIRLWIGADVFYGNAAGVFGEFGERDRILLGVGFGF